jgi:hypothetical protein
VDKAAPVISISMPSTETYLLNQVADAQVTCADGGSGVASCGESGSGGALTPISPSAGVVLNTSTVGTKTVTVDAADNAGNSSSESVTYTVAYDACLLYNPARAHRQGSTVEITLELCDAGGHNVSSKGIVVLAVALDGHGLPRPFHANSGFVFSYRGRHGHAGRYLYDVRSKGLSRGIHTLSFVAGSDPTVHTAAFRIK